MDAIDKKILSELQKDGRLSITDLGERVGLSLSPCHRRVRTLEDTGVISSYRAHIEPVAVGLNFSAVVFATLREAKQDQLLAFERALEPVREIIDARRLFGEPDYILQIVTRDLPAFQRLYDEVLSTLPNVQKLTSTLVMKTVFQNRSYPI